MTTIVTNGRYLLADHRAGIGYKVIPDLVNDERSYDPIEITYNSDRILKILLSQDNFNLKLLDSQVEAISFAGTIEDIVKYKTLMSSLKDKPLPIYDFRNLAMDIISKSKSTLIGVTSKYNAFTIDFSDPGAPIDIIDEDKVLYVGSGARHISTMRRLTKINGLEDMMMVASHLDPDTSPSYSVYGVEEKILYTRVIRDKSYAEQRVLDLV